MSLCIGCGAKTSGPWCNACITAALSTPKWVSSGSYNTPQSAPKSRAAQMAICPNCGLFTTAPGLLCVQCLNASPSATPSLSFSSSPSPEWDEYDDTVELAQLRAQVKELQLTLAAAILSSDDECVTLTLEDLDNARRKKISTTSIEGKIVLTVEDI